MKSEIKISDNFKELLKEASLLDVEFKKLKIGSDRWELVGSKLNDKLAEVGAVALFLSDQD